MSGVVDAFRLGSLAVQHINNRKTPNPPAINFG
jgi:hypothetical protein